MFFCTRLLSLIPMGKKPARRAILIKSALNFTCGEHHEVAILLGYGRNTLTRKIKELEIEE